MTIATVTRPIGERFAARVSELRPNSILLAVDRTLQFREQVTIDLLGSQIRGEVVFAGEREAAITFQTSPEIFELIEAVESDEDEPAGPTLPQVNGDGTIHPGDELEALAFLLSFVSHRPVVAKAATSLDRAELRFNDLALSLRAAPLGNGLVLLVCDDRNGVENAIGRMSHALDRFQPKPVKEEREQALPNPQAFDVPPLDEDGRTVTFSSRAQYKVQHEINLEKGALVVKAAPLPPGTRRDLLIVVPGSAPIPVSAQVMFQGPGTLGFSVALNDALKAALKAALEEKPENTPERSEKPAPMGFMDVSGSSPVPRGASGPRLHPSLGHETDLAPPLGPAELISLHRDRPKEIGGAKGSYLRALDFLLSSDVDARLRIAGEEEIVLWLYRGRVVFSTRKPETPEDLLGRRLAAARLVGRTVIESFAGELGPGKPIGALLVEKGKLTQEQLNPELRAQIVDRAALPAGFSQGTLQVLPWTEPPIRSRLMAVPGRYLMLELVRSELKRWTPEELTKALAKQLDQELHIDADKIEPSLRFGSKEQRFYQRMAERSTLLVDAGVAGGVGPTEGLRLSLIACALGFGRLEGDGSNKDKPAGKRRLTTEDILLEQLERTASSTPFEVLGLTWTATAKEIRAAYETERKKLMLRKREDSSAKDLVAKLERRLDEALRTLTISSERRAIREACANADERQAVAEHMAQQVEMLLFREEFESARDLLDTADELAPIRAVKQLRAKLQSAV